MRLEYIAAGFRGPCTRDGALELRTYQKLLDTVLGVGGDEDQDLVVLLEHRVTPRDDDVAIADHRHDAGVPGADGHLLGT